MWIFNDELAAPEEEFNVGVSFSSADRDDQVSMEYDGTYLRYHGASLNDKKTVYKFGNMSWGDLDRYRLIDFGVAYQVVPLRVYNWIMSNATKMARDLGKFNYMVGKWAVIEEPSNPLSSPQDVLMDSVGFSSNGGTYVSIALSGGSRYDSSAMRIDYGEEIEGSSPVVVRSTTAYDGTDGWVNDAFRAVDFGSQPQLVSRRLYEWFVANSGRVSATAE